MSRSDHKMNRMEPRGKPITNGGARPDGNGQWRPARFAAVVVEELSHRIVSGTLAEGDVLPPNLRFAKSLASAGQSFAKR